MTITPDDALVRTILKGGWLMLLLMVAVSLVFDAWFSLSVALGGIIAMLNFYWLRRHLTSLIGLSPHGATLVAQLRFMSRLALWGILLYIMLVVVRLNAVGVLTGLSVLIVSIIAYTAITLFRRGGQT